MTYMTPCTADPEAWFPVDERPGSAAVALAVAGCNSCAVRDACLAWALANPEYSAAGVWGGLTTAQRDDLLRARPNRVPAPEQAPAARPGGHSRARARCRTCGTRQHARADGTVGRHDRIDTVRGRAMHCAGSGSAADPVSVEATG